MTTVSAASKKTTGEERKVAKATQKSASANRDIQGDNRSSVRRLKTDQSGRKVSSSTVSAGANSRSRAAGNTRLVPIYAGVHQKRSTLATIEEVLAPKIPTRTGGDLSIVEMVKLVVKRIRSRTGFSPMHILGTSGVIDKRRAISEIKRQSAAGLYLIEVEKAYIRIEIEDRIRARSGN